MNTPFTPSAQRYEAGTLQTIAVNTHSAAYEIIGRVMHTIPACGQHLTVIGGGLWVMCDGHDFILKAGQSVVLGKGYHIQISALNHESAFYKLSY